jgi:hypothetical protein
MSIKTRIVRILILLGLIALIAGAWLVVKNYESRAKYGRLADTGHLA